MRPQLSPLSQSLAAKVILSTLLLSLAVVWLTGSALYTQLSDGIKKVSLESSLADARSVFFSAQYQLLLVDGKRDTDIKAAVDEIISTSINTGTTEGAREIILLKVFTQGETAKNGRQPNYSFASNGLLSSTIPQDLRDEITKGDDLAHRFAPLTYRAGVTIDALYVGQRVTIPASGNYEMYLVFTLANQGATLELVQNSLFLTGVVLILLIALITYLVVRQVVRPVREAARVASLFTNGDFAQRLRVESNDEIATLGTAFNEMAASIEAQIGRLENLSKVQQRFVSDVSHELRTPLTTLRMASDVIYAQRDEFDPVIARSAELLIAQIDRFEKLLQELLEVSRFDAEVAVLEPTDFELTALVRRCVADLGVNLEGADSQISFTSPEYPVHIRADFRRVERIMRNLISNALDHADGKPIEIECVETGTDVAISVRDHGAGMEEASLTRVFDRFWRADPSRARTRGGTGLGLSIALEDARLHNGELDAWGAVGDGANFVLTLPRIAGNQIVARPLPVNPHRSRK
jgi:two-component system, OmpR family, sensor histidine kinase MtrB